nr:hypothetical protein CFP56_44463 [Quercus suber]
MHTSLVLPQACDAVAHRHYQQKVDLETRYGSVSCSDATRIRVGTVMLQLTNSVILAHVLKKTFEGRTAEARGQQESQAWLPTVHTWGSFQVS